MSTGPAPSAPPPPPASSSPCTVASPARQGRGFGFSVSSQQTAGLRAHEQPCPLGLLPRHRPRRPLPPAPARWLRRLDRGEVSAFRFRLNKPLGYALMSSHVHWACSLGTAPAAR